eukprot:scaffold28973_cov118-Isochrysis_galbana.AAC.5
MLMIGRTCSSLRSGRGVVSVRPLFRDLCGGAKSKGVDTVTKTSVQKGLTEAAKGTSSGVKPHVVPAALCYVRGPVVPVAVASCSHLAAALGVGVERRTAIGDQKGSRGVVPERHVCLAGCNASDRAGERGAQ